MLTRTVSTAVAVAVAVAAAAAATITTTATITMVKAALLSFSHLSGYSSLEKQMDSVSCYGNVLSVES